MDKSIEIATQAVVSGISTISTQLSALSVQYGPDVISLGLEIARIGAIQNVLGVLLCVAIILLFPITFGYARKSHKAYYKLPEGERKGSNGCRQEEWCERLPGALCIASCIFSSIAAVISFIVFVNIVSVYAIIGMFRPEVWIAYKAIGVVFK